MSEGEELQKIGNIIGSYSDYLNSEKKLRRLCKEWIAAKKAFGGSHDPNKNYSKLAVAIRIAEANLISAVTQTEVEVTKQ